MKQEDKILSALGLINDKIGTGRSDKRYIIDRVEELETKLNHLQASVNSLNDLADHAPEQNLRWAPPVNQDPPARWYEVGVKMDRHSVPGSLVGSEDYYKELAACVAESEGYTILTDELKNQIEAEAVKNYLKQLTLDDAGKLVKERIPNCFKSVEITR